MRVIIIMTFLISLAMSCEQPEKQKKNQKEPVVDVFFLKEESGRKVSLLARVKSISVVPQPKGPWCILFEFDDKIEDLVGEERKLVFRIGEGKLNEIVVELTELHRVSSILAINNASSEQAETARSSQKKKGSVGKGKGVCPGKAKGSVREK